MAQPVLRDNELPTLTRLVGDLYDFQAGARERRVFVQQAGLGQFLGGIDLSGAPNTVAGDLLGRLDRHGHLAAEPCYHALGKLLAYVLTLPDLPDDDGRTVARIVLERGLVCDPAYNAGLRSRYGLDQVPSPEAGLAKAALSPPPAAFRPEPGFAPQVDDPVHLEKVLNSEDNFLDLYLLLGATYAAQAVARIELPEHQPIGTGFLIGPDLLMTNQHVLTSLEEAAEATVRFGFVQDELAVTRPGRAVGTQAGRYWSSPEAELDYALVRLAEAPLKDRAAAGGDLSILELVRAGQHRGYLVAVPQFIPANQRVNILQHPKGRPLKAVLTQNRVSANMSATRVYYLADTDEGSSGSPVFNSQWQVIALHHGHKDRALRPAGDGARVSSINEGVPMRAILADLKRSDLERLLPRS